MTGNRKTNRRLGFIRTVLPLILVVATVGIGAVLLKTPPQVPKSERRPVPAVVGVADLELQSVQAFVQAFGTVVAARETRVQPEVAGRIVAMHDGLTDGGLIGNGEILFEIDQSDYQIAVDGAMAEVNVTRFEIEGLRAGVEALRGRAGQVEAELDFLNWNMERLGKLAEQDQAGEAEAREVRSKYAGKRAALAALHAQIIEQERTVDRGIAQTAVAESRLAAAKLALSRTKVKAPFDAIVLSESVETGQLVSPQTTVATLAATDVFWVEAAINVAQLKNIRFSEGRESNGSAVRITLVTGGESVSRNGVALRPLAQLDPRGRMAQFLIAVQDPLNLRPAATGKGESILLGSYVRLSIDAGTLENVYAIPRYALRENNRVWVRDANHKLGIREVEVVWRRQDDVLIRDGFKAGDQLVTTHLASVVPGMPLSVREEAGGAEEAVSQRTITDAP